MKEEQRLRLESALEKKYEEKSAQTCSVGDFVVIDFDRRGVPANGDAGWCGRRDHQISGSVRD